MLALAGFLAIFQLFDFLVLLLNFPLLRFDMLLGLLISGLGVLHMVANCIAGHAAECAANSSASSGRCVKFLSMT